MSASTPRVDSDLLPALRADLARSRFTVAGVTELLGPMASAALDREQALPAQRVTAVSDEPCATLVRLFTLGDPVDVREAAAGDEVVADLVGAVAEHLEPGGIAQFLGNWEVPRGTTWTERVGAWLDGTGLDACVVQREVQDPAAYAETWARDGGHHPGTADFNAMYSAWLDDFAARDVEAIGFGVLTLQRPRTERPPFVDLMDVPWPVESPMGPAVLAGLDARTWLAEHDDDAVLEVPWWCAADVHEERHTVPGAADPSVILLRQGGGLRRNLALSTVTAAFASVCDGDLSARAAAAAIAGLLHLDGTAVRAEIAAFVRDAAKDGLLVRERPDRRASGEPL